LLFILAIILVLILIYLKIEDKTKRSVYDNLIIEKNDVSGTFKSIFIDAKLERELHDFILDERNLPQVSEEVLKAFSEMEHFRDIKDFSLHNSYFNIEWAALDIMLANRGKIRALCNTCGYDCKFYPGYNEKDELAKVRAYEFVEWLEKTLTAQGLPAKILVRARGYNSKYVWACSSASYCGFGEKLKKFSPKIITPKEYNIPAPHYKNQEEV